MLRSPISAEVVDREEAQDRSDVEGKSEEKLDAEEARGDLGILLLRFEAEGGGSTRLENHDSKKEFSSSDRSVKLEIEPALELELVLEPEPVVEPVAVSVERVVEQRRVAVAVELGDFVERRYQLELERKRQGS